VSIIFDETIFAYPYDLYILLGRSVFLPCNWVFQYQLWQGSRRYWGPD